MLIAANVLHVLAAILVIFSMASWIRFAWKHHCWKRHSAEPPDMVRFIAVFFALIFGAFTMFMLGSECALRYVRSWAESTRVHREAVTINGRAGDFDAFLTSLSKLQVEPADHRACNGPKFICQIDSAGRSLNLELRQQSAQSRKYWVHVRLGGSSSLWQTRVGVIFLTPDAVELLGTEPHSN